jgi:hypothetical protein
MKAVGTCPLCGFPKVKIRLGPIVFQDDMTCGTICRLLNEEGEEIAWTASPVPERAILALGICGQHLSRLLMAVPLCWLN